jgi:hypothetical protein
VALISEYGLLELRDLTLFIVLVEVTRQKILSDTRPLRNPDPSLSSLTLLSLFLTTSSFNCTLKKVSLRIGFASIFAGASIEGRMSLF